MTKFEDLPWHDAELLSLYVDRQNAGERDVIYITVCWPNGAKARVTFNDCYYFAANMNFGIIATESILRANSFSEREDLAFIQAKWRHIGVEIQGLNCYEIETSSTASTLMIYAIGFQVDYGAD